MSFSLVRLEMKIAMALKAQSWTNAAEIFRDEIPQLLTHCQKLEAENQNLLARLQSFTFEDLTFCRECDEKEICTYVENKGKCAQCLQTPEDYK